MTFVSELEPKEIWQHFDKILTIPRGSKNESAIREYVIEVAQKHDLEYKQDAAGNVVVRKPATQGHEKASIVILQSHLDMVNEKNAEVEHDFSKDPIKPQRDGEYLKASGTTLGADNGIGVATALAIMESKDFEHGPLELLFTVDEETGLTGASNLAPDLLKGRRLINLDTEEEGVFYVGCAGGAGMNLTLPLKFQHVPPNSVALEVKLHGLRGGHSGVDIHLQRGNAIKLLARMLFSLSRSFPFYMANINGGNMHNAIPREAFATLLVDQNQRGDVEKRLQELFQAIREEFKPADPDMQLTVSESSVTDQVFDKETQQKVLGLLNALPHGVIAMSYDIPDLVETSSNLATVNVEDTQLLIHVSNRSSVATALQGLQERIAAIGMLAGAKIEELEGYPGWKPNLDSPLLKIARDVFQQVFGKEPEVKAVHAGLECGIIGEKYPGMDMISIGPQIEFPHSPDERVKISSVGDFYKFLKALLERLAE